MPASKLIKKSFIQKMETLYILMQDVAVDLDYYGGFRDKLVMHSKDLFRTSYVLKSWIDGLKKDMKK